MGKHIKRAPQRVLVQDQSRIQDQVLLERQMVPAALSACLFNIRCRLEASWRWGRRGSRRQLVTQPWLIAVGADGIASTDPAVEFGRAGATAPIDQPVLFVMTVISARRTRPVTVLGQTCHSISLQRARCSTSDVSSCESASGRAPAKVREQPEAVGSKPIPATKWTGSDLNWFVSR